MSVCVCNVVERHNPLWKAAVGRVVVARVMDQLPAVGSDVGVSGAGNGEPSVGSSVAQRL